MVFLGMGKVDGRMGLPVAVGSRYVYFYLRISVIGTASFRPGEMADLKMPRVASW